MALTSIVQTTSTDKNVAQQEAQPGVISNQFQQSTDKAVPQITPNQQSFEADLEQDLVGSQAALQRAQVERGIKSQPQMQQFRERGIRIKGRAIAKESFSKASIAQNNAIKELITASGLSDEVEIAEVQNNMNNRLNQIKRDMLTRGIAFEKKMAEMKWSVDKKANMRKLIGRGIGGIVGGIVGGYFGGSQGAAVGAKTGGGAGAGTAGQIEGEL